MPPKEITEHGQVPPLFPVACRISQTGLQNGNLIVHEVQVQETPLLYIGKLVKLCKIPVLGQIQMLLNVSPVQILILHLAEYLAVRQKGTQVLHCIRYGFQGRHLKELLIFYTPAFHCLHLGGNAAVSNQAAHNLTPLSSSGTEPLHILHGAGYNYLPAP